MDACATLHIWGGLSPWTQAACQGRGWDGGTRAERGQVGGRHSPHHLLYFLTFELCKYTTYSIKERQKKKTLKK